MVVSDEGGMGIWEQRNVGGYGDMVHRLQEQSAAQEKATCEVKLGLVGVGTWGGMGM